jgi:hypothetical protein
MLQIIASIVISVGAGQGPALDPSRIVDTWEITNSGYDRETVTFKSNRSFVQTGYVGKKADKQLGTWQIVDNQLDLRYSGKRGVARVTVLLNKAEHLDGLKFSSDTIASRAYWVAEQRLIRAIDRGMDPSLTVSIGHGNGYRLGFYDGKNPHFAIDYWSDSDAVTAKIKKLALADLRKRGLKPVHPVVFDFRN